VSHDPRTRAFQALAALLVSENSLADALTAMLDVAVDAVPHAFQAGLTMSDAHGRAATPVFTDPEVPEVDQAQYDSGRGPCMDAWRSAEVVRIDDLAAASSSYPEFAAAASDHGVRSTISIPLVAEADSLGALNLYSAEVGAFSPQDEQFLVDLAPAATAFLVNARAYWHAFDLSEQLNDALTSRSMIDQAKGMLMAADPSLDADGAFEVLRTASRRENVKLRDIARRITDRRSMSGTEGHEPSPPP
jgi:GAF domain-containing protein